MTPVVNDGHDGLSLFTLDAVLIERHARDNYKEPEKSLSQSLLKFLCREDPSFR